ncbi:histidine kinase [Winogradskyella sp. 3972H.M.0a.05]|uniref:sensor histidine kinase n=1 Tax=Winogradskyella sp. 3972H.M.0a.05 TaxID=2950277 RepID=UPI003390D517
MSFRKHKLSYRNLPIALPKIIVVALLVSVFLILKAYTSHIINDLNYDFSWKLNSLKILIKNLLWVLLTPVIYVLVKTIQETKINLTRIIVICIACILIAAFHNTASSRIDDFVNYLNSGYLKDFFGQNNQTVLIIGSFTSLIELLFISAFFFAIDYQKKYIINQKALIAAQLNALRMQLQPHFLFNTLHSIASMIDINTKNAQAMLSKLGDLLRRVLEYDTHQMVTVAEEMKFIQDYLDLEQMRYQDRLTISYSISKDTLDMKVPTMIFQPLVENAIKHGVINVSEQSEIVIRIQQEFNSDVNENLLFMEISNNYNDDKVSKKSSTGIGLENIKKRLQSFYKDRFVFNAQKKTDQVYIAKIGMPIIS